MVPAKTGGKALIADLYSVVVRRILYSTWKSAVWKFVPIHPHIPLLPIESFLPTIVGLIEELFSFSQSPKDTFYPVVEIVWNRDQNYSHSFF